MARVRSAGTGPEIIVRRLLHRLGVRFSLKRSTLPGSPDVVSPSRRLAVFVHGCFWHQHTCPRGSRQPATRRAYWLPKLAGNVARDRRAQRALRRLGWRVAVVWECQTRPGRQAALVARLRRLVSAGGATRGVRGR